MFPIFFIDLCKQKYHANGQYKLVKTAVGTIFIVRNN